MAYYLGKEWTKRDLRSYIGDPQQICGITSYTMNQGKAEGVKGCTVDTGCGFNFTVLPGRGMDIPSASYHGKNIGFRSGTGITSPAYYEEPGINWLRSFYVGLLTTCGITYAGAPDTDQGVNLGLHGRVANAAAEDVKIDQRWEGDEYKLSIEGTMREAMAWIENVIMTRKIETALGRKDFVLTDVIENRGFAPVPLMMLYHINFGFPLLGSGARVMGPIVKTVPRDEEAAKDNGLEECMSYPEPIPGYKEKVMFHNLAADAKGDTFVALSNPDVGDGSPLGVVLRFNIKELPTFTQWKMPQEGFYVTGLEPGTATPIGRGKLRESGELVFIEPQETYRIKIKFEVLDTFDELAGLEKESAVLKG